MNPNKALRIAYVTALANISVPVWDRRIPKDTPEPLLYVLVTSQTAIDADRTKCGNQNKDCTILLQTIYKQDQGYADSVPVDDVQDEIITIVDNNGQLTVQGWQMIDTELELNTVDDAFEFDTQTVIRGLTRFRHKLTQA